MKNRSPKPPRLATALLLWFLRDDLVEEVMGDLEEKFDIARGQSPWRARINYWYQVLNYLRPFAMRRKHDHPSTQYDMFKNYFIIGWRNMARHRMYSAINIGGFALGIAACILLALYIHGELSYDSFYKNKDRIYRVIATASWEGQRNAGADFPHPFADVLAESFPEIERVGQYNASPIFRTGSAEVRPIDRPDNTHEDGLVWMDQGMVEVLEFPFIAGNPLKALTEPNSIIITRSKAEKYFRGEDAVGKSLIVNDDSSRVFHITGVIEDFRSGSHLRHDFIMSPEGKVFWQDERTSWCCSNWISYVRLRPDAHVADLESKISDLIVNGYMMPETMKNQPSKSDVEWLKSMRVRLQPVDEIYMNYIGVHDSMSHGDIRFIWLFGSIAIFILILAGINFVNLSTARSANRAKEVGIRKTIGSARSSLIRQFLTESYLFSVIAIVIGVFMALLFLPAFNNLTGKTLTLPWEHWWLFPALFALSLLIGVLAGVYPSIYLSSFMPVKVLKGSVTAGHQKTRLRSALVIFQFTISIVLIVGTLIVNRQMDYMLSKKLGFEKDQVLVLEGTVTLKNQILPLKEELLQLAEVSAVSVTGYLPIEGADRNGGPHWLEGMKPDDGVSGQQWSVDHDYVKAMGLKITQGREFSSGIQSDSQAMIINRTMAQKLGLHDPVGQRIQNYYGVFEVIGVVEDFHFQSMKERIAPVSMFVRKDVDNMVVKLNTRDMAASIGSITRVWTKFSPHQPIRFQFLDDQYAIAYADVDRFRTVLTVFTTLAIVIACLGLFALSAFMIEQRAKEISIRMVLGAPVSSILRLLSQNYVVLVSRSFIIAAPLSWYLMTRWLEDYIYKIDITWDVFAMTGIAAIVLALLTVGYLSVKAAMTKPVVNLKAE